MKHLVKLGLVVSLVACMPALAQEESESAWSVSGNATVTSDYIFRGISQSSEKVAFQPSVTVEHESGFYGYAWGSNVDFDTAGDGISTEIDYGLGWSSDVAEGVNLDLLAVRFTYPGSNSGFGIDYNEYSAKVTIADNWFALFAYSDDYVNSNQDSLYYQIGGGWDIGDTGVHFAATAGYYDLSDYAGASYYDFRAGFSKDFGPVNLDLSYYDTSSFSEEIASKDLANSRLVLTASYDFDF